MIQFSGSSLRRFGQSIKRIVREVEEQNSGKDQQLKFLELFWYFKEIKLIFVIQVDESRDVLVNRNVALNRASDHLTKVITQKHAVADAVFFTVLHWNFEFNGDSAE